MKKYDASVKVNAPVDAVLKLMATAEYAREEAKLDGAVKADAAVKESTDEKIVIHINREDPSRGAGGKIAGKTEKNIITQEWNLGTGKCRWSVRVPGMEKLVNIAGETWLEPAGEGVCRLCEAGGVDIKVPVIGNLVASGVVSDIKNNFSRKAKFIEKQLG